MSSSNYVKISVIEEQTFGSTPSTGNFESARFTSESMSGSPQVAESQVIRNDRYGSGQVVTGVDVAGELGFEIAPSDACFDLYLKSAMHNLSLIHI